MVVIIRSFVGRIMQKGLRRASLTRSSHKNNNVVPEDVREGYFAVHAVKGGETKRFIVELESLNDPEFMALLEQAHQEFGFRQKGALSLPCSPHEFQKVLDSGRTRRLSRSS